ncbi:MAG: PKD domain-containing protein [Bacteroidales bacterium]|nr:PKD domain-containing protein [Bacteroidales bacterium]
MKTIKIIPILIVSLIALFSCTKEGEYNLEDIPDLDFKVYFDGFNVTFVNNSAGATGVTWDFGDNTPIASGDSVTHTYTEIGRYLITMSGINNGTEQTFHTVLRVDKPSLIELDDDSFDDWDNVTYPDFILAGKGDVLGGKVDYDANYVYFYIQFNAVENAGLYDHIVGMYMDTDNSVVTGFSLQGFGCDYGVEGNFPSGDIWPSMVDLANGDPGWPFVEYDPENPVAVGYFEENSGIVSLEFSISREAFKIESNAFKLYLSIMDTDWSDIGNLATQDLDNKISVKMDKQ